MEGLFASIDHSPIASVITDARLPDNPIVAVNPAFCALTGYGRDEIVGRNCRFLAGADTEPAARATLRRAVAEGRPALVELTNYRKDGSAFLNAVMVAPVIGEGGELAYFLGSQMDVGAGSGLSAPRRQRAEQLVGALTRRQLQVLEHMIAGYRNKQIAGFLAIDEKTVKMHRASLLTRLGVGSSAEAIRIAVEAGVRPNGPG
ncbi:MAG TPA: PAS domain-containing protein [Allosphingosinicella sp.]|nr:PAS domain-containing protein [Allosphingosinicella sp.]